MFRAWLNMWRNTFRYKGNTTLKDYWLACIANVLAMFITVVPFALVLRNFPISPEAASAAFIVLFHIPVLALYFRRANDANWKGITALFMAVAMPIASGLIVGLFPSIPKGVKWPLRYSLCGKLLALSFGLFFYGGFLGLLLFEDVAALPFLSISGLILGTVTFFIFFVRGLLEKE